MSASTEFLKSADHPPVSCRRCFGAVAEHSGATRAPSCNAGQHAAGAAVRSGCCPPIRRQRFPSMPPVRQRIPAKASPQPSFHKVGSLPAPRPPVPSPTTLLFRCRSPPPLWVRCRRPSLPPLHVRLAPTTGPCGDKKTALWVPQGLPGGTPQCFALAAAVWVPFPAAWRPPRRHLAGPWQASCCTSKTRRTPAQPAGSTPKST